MLSKFNYLFLNHYYILLSNTRGKEPLAAENRNPDYNNVERKHTSQVEWTMGQGARESTPRGKW